MAKIIKFDTEARSKMLTGVNTLANAVNCLLYTSDAADE